MAQGSKHDLGALASYHLYTREMGVNTFLYRAARMILAPAILGWFSVSRAGRENVPSKGAVLVIANHRSFLDPFLVALSMPKDCPLHFMGKAELFQRPRLGWFFNRLGAFPVRRGEADQDAILTAKMILERGGVVVLFPEGTRMRYGGLGPVRRGAGHLALLTGASILPLVIRGTEKTRRKFLILPRHCSVDIEPPILGQLGLSTPEHAEQVLQEAWEKVSNKWLELGGSGEPGERFRPPQRPYQRLKEILLREVHLPKRKAN